MTRFFHLLGFELRRMRWFALWIVGLLLTELAIRAWLVFGPVGANWPEPPVPFLWMAILLMLSLVVATITLFLDNNNAGTRSPALTQAIPRALIAGTKLTTLGVLLGLIWATMILDC
jgi:hypothetical protein